MNHRPWCGACPWRNLDWMRENGYDYVIEDAKKNPDVYVCHTRLGPCDGPRISRVAPLRQQETPQATTEGSPHGPRA